MGFTSQRWARFFHILLNVITQKVDPDITLKLPQQTTTRPRVEPRGVEVAVALRTTVNFKAVGTTATFLSSFMQASCFSRWSLGDSVNTARQETAVRRIKRFSPAPFHHEHDVCFAPTAGVRAEDRGNTLPLFHRHPKGLRLCRSDSALACTRLRRCASTDDHSNPSIPRRNESTCA